jgi:hypothetical protein
MMMESFDGEMKLIPSSYFNAQEEAEKLKEENPDFYRRIVEHQKSRPPGEEYLVSFWMDLKIGIMELHACPVDEKRRENLVSSKIGDYNPIAIPYMYDVNGNIV